MIELVEIDHVTPSHQPGDQAEVSGVSGGEHQTGFLAHKLGECTLQLFVKVQSSVEKTAAGAAGAVAMECAGSSLEDLRMVGKTEVVVRPKHDPLLPVDNHDGVLRFRDRIEVRI